jgi:hypothetical protein
MAGADTSLAVERLEALGQSGLTVSICCGPCGRDAFRWSVQVLSRLGEEHAVEIAEIEIGKRGWYGRARVEAPLNNHEYDDRHAPKHARELHPVGATDLAREHRRAMAAARRRVTLLLVVAIAVALVGWWIW